MKKRKRPGALNHKMIFDEANKSDRNTGKLDKQKILKSAINGRLLIINLWCEIARNLFDQLLMKF